MHKITLPTGFTFDYTNLFGPQAVTEADMSGLIPALGKAVKAAQKMRLTGEVDDHVSKDGDKELVLFSQLPYVEEGHINSPAVLAKLYALQEHVKEEIDLVVSLGIGGSYLGGKVIFDAHCGEFWNSMSREERGGYPELLFGGNNVDPKRMADMIAYIKRQATRKEGSYKVMLIVISKSGSTIEPMSALMVLQSSLEEAQIAYEVVAVTDPHEGEKETLLHKLATEEKWPMFAVPDGVGGRFSVFTEVGLIVGAVVGFDIDGFLAGAKAMDEVCKSAEVLKNPALLGAALKYLASEKYGRQIEVFMPYGDYLKSLSEWYVQLLAESLGKHRKGGDGYYSRTPVVAVGTTDMHAQTQEHQEGRKNKVVQFLQIADWQAPVKVPARYNRYAALAAFSDLALSDILTAALESNAAALTGDQRFNATITLPTLNAFHLGELMFMLCWAIFFEGQLAGVDAFNQPGVEVYKKLLGPKLKSLKEKEV